MFGSMMWKQAGRALPQSRLVLQRRQFLSKDWLRLTPISIDSRTSDDYRSGDIREKSFMTKMQLRSFSQTVSGERVQDDHSAAKDVPWSQMSRQEKIVFAVSKYGMWAVLGTGFAYAISKSSMWLTGTFMGLSFKTVGWWGFLVGFNSGLATAAGLYAVTRGLYIRPENVRQKAFNLVASNAQVQSQMGLSIIRPLKSGVMRAYSLEGGSLALDRASRRLVWRHPRIKMLFQVYGGNNHQAAVYAEAHRTWNGLTFDFVSVDYLTMQEPPVLVEGSEKFMQVEGQLRDLVQLKKRYV